MSAFSAWALSITGIVLIGLLIDVVMPEGQTNKYVKSVFAIMTVFVIAAPLPKILKSELNLTDIFGEDAAYEIDVTFIERLNRQKVEALKKTAAGALEEAGYTNAEFSVTYETKDNALKINRIFVDVSELSYKGQPANKDKETDEEIKKIFASVFNVGKEVISVYG